MLGYGLCKVAGVCGRVKCVESAWKVCGKFEGMGVESAWVWVLKVNGKLRGCVGVQSSWKVRGKFEGGKSRMWLGMFEGGGL